MKTVTIYTRMFCPYCYRALSLLKSKNVEINEIKVGMNPDLHAEMVERSGGGTTVPQIFIGDRHIGGFDDMVALERAGKLDPVFAE